MSPRRSPTRLFCATSSLFAAATLLTSCGMPQPTEPPPPPMAEAPEPELYGGPVDEPGMAPGPLPGEAYAQGPDNPYADPAPVGGMGRDAPPPPIAEMQRPGWGTMEPVPNPPGTAPTRGDRAYAQARPAPRTGSEGPLPRAEERLGAYAEPGAVPPPKSMSNARSRSPTPCPCPKPRAPASPEGAPAASYPPVIVTMQPVPNPDGAARREALSGPRFSPRPALIAPAERTSTAATRPNTARRTARAADDRLMGGPGRPRAEAARPARTASQSPARAATATVGASAQRQAAAPAARPTTRQAPATRAQPRRAALPPANTPAGRAARLKQLEGGLRTLVERDSTLTAPERFQPGREEQITLTMPQGLAEILTKEAGAVGLRELASRAETRVQLRGEGWNIEPEEPQTDELRAGRTQSFTWRATPERGAGPLTTDVQAALSGGGRFETLQLGQLTREVSGPGSAGAEGGGLSWRAIGLGVLLLAAMLGVLLFARRGGGEDGGRKRYNRRRPDPVNLTPYAPKADTDAPRDPSEPDPARP